MKKVFPVLFVISSSCAFAQKSFFGIDAGVNVANMRIHGTGPVFGPPPTPPATLNIFSQNSVKPSVSFFYQFSFSETLAVRAHASYLGMGYKDPFGNNVDINYFTFPISIQYAANKHLNFGAGPYVSFTLGGTELNNEPITKSYHKNDFGFFIGGEHDVYKNFALGVKYFIGTKNIWLDDQNGTIVRTNRALQFIVIYKFKKTN